jgi:hypothetical protein
VAYESGLARKDEPIVEAMRELAGQYPRYGYRRIRREVREVAAAYPLPLPIRSPMGFPPRNVLRLDPRS